MAIPKPVASVVKPGVDLGRTNVGVLGTVETVWAYMTDTVYEDGSARECASLLVFVEEGTVKTCLNDRQEGRTMWATGSCLEDCLLSLEERLASGRGDWRASKGRPGRKR